jgi:hypothetical protein
LILSPSSIQRAPPLLDPCCVGGDLEGGGSHGEGRGWLPKGRRERGRGRWPKGWKGVGVGCNNWEKERWSTRVGKEGGSHPSDRDQRPKHALSSELLTTAEKCQKIYCFPEECLPKLQTPMPQNMKEKIKRNLTSFQKTGMSHRCTLDMNCSLSGVPPESYLSALFLDFFTISLGFF